MSKLSPYYATLDRNGTEDEITIHAPDGRRMLCVAFWDEQDIASAQQLKDDAALIIEALNANQKRLARRKPKLTDRYATIDIAAVLESRRQIAHIWGVEDVAEVRPDLTGEQAWEVLQYAERKLDSDLSISWDTLEIVAGDMFPESTNTSEKSHGN